MGQSVMKGPANAVSSEEGTVAVGWGWSASVKREMDRRERPEGSRGGVRKCLGFKKHKSDHGLLLLKTPVASPCI